MNINLAKSNNYYYILKQEVSYQTFSPALRMPVAITVAKGELFQPILDMPNNFSNGLTILHEDLITRSNLFEKAILINTQENEQRRQEINTDRLEELSKINTRRIEG